MTTEKTQTIPARLSKEIIGYLDDVIRNSPARSRSDAIRLIVIERMIEDKERGKIGAFKYLPAPTKRDRRPRKKIEPATFPLGEAPPIAGPEPAKKDNLPETEIIERKASEPVRSTEERTREEGPKKWAESKKPAYPGTREQWEKEPLKDQFEPPED